MVCHLNLLAKGEERYKRIQAVSPSILLAKGEVNEKLHNVVKVKLGMLTFKVSC